MADRISCLMVTKDRLAMVKRSIEYYVRQTWQNKELIIVTDGSGAGQQAVLAYVKSMGRTDISCVMVQGPSTLGHLRNETVRRATGGILCQWDDDDYNHHSRLQAQLTHLDRTGAEVSFFHDQLHYFTDTRELFWTNWSFQRTQDMDIGAPQTLMCRRSAGLTYPLEGPAARLGEDAAAQVELYRKCKVTGLKNMGYLYTYVYHGHNTYHRSHHRMIVEWMSHPSSFVAPHMEQLAKHLSEYFPAPVPHLVCKDGQTVGIPQMSHQSHGVDEKGAEDTHGTPGMKIP